MRELCTATGTILIFDEVMTGFRLGRGGAQELFGVTPDLSCFGKVIGGGLPVGAVGGRAEIMDFLAPLGPVYQAGTLSGNPLAMAAGLAQLKALENENVFARLDERGAQLEEGIRFALKAENTNFSFYRYGSMFCLFFTSRPVHTTWRMREAPTCHASRAFSMLCWIAGFTSRPRNLRTGFISAAHSPEDIDTTVRTMAEALRA